MPVAPIPWDLIDYRIGIFLLLAGKLTKIPVL